MSFDLTNKNIQDTFQNVLQRTGSDNRLYDLEGNEIGDLKISGSHNIYKLLPNKSFKRKTKSRVHWHNCKTILIKKINNHVGVPGLSATLLISMV